MNLVQLCQDLTRPKKGRNPKRSCRAEAPMARPSPNTLLSRRPPVRASSGRLIRSQQHCVRVGEPPADFALQRSLLDDDGVALHIARPARGIGNHLHFSSRDRRREPGGRHRSMGRKIISERDVRHKGKTDGPADLSVAAMSAPFGFGVLLIRGIAATQRKWPRQRSGDSRANRRNSGHIPTATRVGRLFSHRKSRG